MAVLGITPELYYDLTGTETAIRLKGVADARVDSLRQTRTLATLIRNANFKNPVSESEFMPLPGDEELIRFMANSPEESFYQLAAAMGATITTEANA